jgi:hypothetical protein
MDDTPLVFPVDNATLLVGLAVLVPGVVTLLTKSHAPDWVKNLVNLFISALVSAMNQFFEDGFDDFTWRLFVTTTALTFAMSVLAYQKIWKDSPIHGWLAGASKRVGVSAAPRMPVNTDQTIVTPVLVEASTPVAVGSSQVPVVAAVERGDSAGSSSGDGGVGAPQSFVARADEGQSSIIPTGPLGTGVTPGSHQPAPNPFEPE